MRFCIYIECVHVIYEILCTGWYRYCCVNVAYAVLGIDGAMYIMDMWCCVHMVMCACWICSVVYGAMYMLYMQCYAHMVLCACCTCGTMYI